MSSGSLSSSPLTFQFALGMVLVDVCGADCRRSSSSSWYLWRFCKVFTQDRVQQRVRSRSLTFQFLMVARTSKILVSHRFLKKLLEKRFKFFFCTFPGGKKCKDWPALGEEQFPESSPSTRAAHSDQFWEDEFGGTWMLMPSGRWYLLCSDPEVFWDGPGWWAWRTTLGEAASSWSCGTRGTGECVLCLVHPPHRDHGSFWETGTGPCPLCTRCSHLESGAFSP